MTDTVPTLDLTTDAVDLTVQLVDIESVSKNEQVIAAGGLADVRAIPRLVRLEYARAAEAGATVDAVTWPDCPAVEELSTGDKANC